MFEESVSLWASIYSWFTPTVLFVFLNLMIGTIFITSSLASSKRTSDHHLHLPHSPSVLQRLKSINFHSYRSPEPISAFDKYPDFNNTQHQTPTEQSNTPQQQQQQQSYLSRSPSVLDRLKSFNLYNYISQEPDSTAQPKPQESEKIDEIAEQMPGLEKEEENSPTLDEVYSKINNVNNHMNRTKSDTEPAAGEIPPKLPRKMRKSASTKSPFSHFEENDVVEARRPATVREGKKNKAPKLAEVEEVAPVDEEVDAKADDFINKFKQQLKLQRIDSIIRYKEMVKRGSEK